MDKRATGYGPPSRDSEDNNRTSIVRTTIMDIGAGYSSNSPYEAHSDTVSTAYNINDNMASSASRLSRITPYYPVLPRITPTILIRCPQLSRHYPSLHSYCLIIVLRKLLTLVPFVSASFRRSLSRPSAMRMVLKIIFFRTLVKW
jgi:hypothetical protein